MECGVATTTTTDWDWTGLDWTALNNNQLQPLAPGLPLRLQGLLASQSQYCNSQTRTMYGHHSNMQQI